MWSERISSRTSHWTYLTVFEFWSANVIFKPVPFIPQLVLLTAVALLFCFKEHVGFCLFIQTSCNKVGTSQYFLRYIHQVSSGDERKALFYLQLHIAAHVAQNGKTPNHWSRISKPRRELFVILITILLSICVEILQHRLFNELFYNDSLSPTSFHGTRCPENPDLRVSQVTTLTDNCGITLACA